MPLARWNSVIIGVLIAIAGVSASALTKPTLGDLESVALKRLSDGSNDWQQLTGVPLPRNAPDLVRQHLLRLFRDDVFVRATTDWLNDRQTANIDEIFAQWVKHYEQTLMAGLARLNDTDVATLWRGVFYRPTFFEQKNCMRMLEPDVSEAALEAIANFSNAEIIDYLAVLRRAYLGALDNKTPAPPPSDESLALANLQLLVPMPAADRNRIVTFLITPSGMAHAEQCAAAARYAQAIDAATPETAAIIRRAQLVSSVRTVLDPTRRQLARSEARGTTSEQFEPGEAVLTYPREAAKAGIEGTMRVRISVDKTGRAVRVTTIERSFNKAFAILDDGSQISVEEMFDPIVAVYYKAGRFTQRFKDGSPEAYTVVVPLDWKLE